MARPQGRPPTTRKQTNIQIEEHTLDTLNLYLMNPKTGRIQYGALSDLVNKLFEVFLTKIEGQNVDPLEVFKAYGLGNYLPKSDTEQR